VNAFLLDTNTVSLLVRGHSQVDARFRSELWNGAEFQLSAVVDYEARRGFLWRNATTLERKYEAVVGDFRYLELDRQTWVKAADLWAFSRRSAMPLPDADLLIAEQAITCGTILVTNNERHFSLFIPMGLQVEDWTK
jgi:predicted nucleic acid-binding protein